MKAFTAEGLQNIIERFQFKCSHRVIVIGSSKDHLRIVFDTFQNLQAGQTWHSHIKENQFGTQLINEDYRLVTVGGFTHDSQPVHTLQEILDGLPRQRFIFDDQRANSRLSFHPILTSIHPPGFPSELKSPVRAGYPNESLLDRRSASSAADAQFLHPFRLMPRRLSA